MIMHW